MFDGVLRLISGRALVAIALVVNLLLAGWVIWAVTSGRNDCAAKWRAAAPIYAVDSNSAPAAIYNSADELIPRSQADLYARALRDAGVVNTETILPGAKHAEAYGDTALPNGMTVWQDTAAFIKAHE